MFINENKTKTSCINRGLNNINGGGIGDYSGL
jgi:hypothetical protein